MEGLGHAREWVAGLLLLLLAGLFKIRCELWEADAVPVFAILGRPKNPAWFDPDMPDYLASSVHDLVIFVLFRAK